MPGFDVPRGATQIQNRWLRGDPGGPFLTPAVTLCYAAPDSSMSEEPIQNDWQKWLGPRTVEPDRGAPPRPRRWLYWVGGVVLLIVLGSIANGMYADWLWFQSLGYGSVYTTILGTRVSLFFIGTAAAAALLFGNLLLGARLTPRDGQSILPGVLVAQLGPWLKTVVILGVIVLSLIFGATFQGNWEMVLAFLNGQPFGVSDPLFHRDVSFFVFDLPFWEFLRGWLIGVTVFCTILSAVVYGVSGLTQRPWNKLGGGMLWHLGVLVAILVGLIGWGYWFGVWNLVLSSEGAVFGAGYTDVHARLPSKWILFGVSFVVIAAFAVSLWKQRWRWVGYTVGVWIVAAILIGAIFPFVVQRFQVQPSELARETPYIAHNIEYTRQAFGLNRITEQSYPAAEAPSVADLTDNRATIDNIRLWDPTPLKDTYNQIQAIRLYYNFHDVDVDRYTLDGEYRQVMLAARELAPEQLSTQAQTWVNRRLQFTHGYGAVMSPVNEVTPQGLPVLWAKDIPPVGDFAITRPQIYFGERDESYVIVKTNTEEFDYPVGEQNAFTTWEGNNGVPLRGINRLVYAWEFGDINLLISNELKPESQVLYRRAIQERVNTLAPFLQLDNDPYLVVIRGELFWIQDAYTVTDRYPYSEPQGEVNYVRNSVKVIVDAYDGSVRLYVSEPDDALIRTYQRIFPDLFQPLDDIPAELRAHLRYPEDMFQIQARVYQTYHMQDVRVFYNKEDLWAVPREFYRGGEKAVDPYYVIMRLMGEPEAEFLLMQPFTPVNKSNAIGWLAARNDGENYGTLLAYSFPKEKLVYGPSQIENRIQQDTVITEQLALWGRGGSQVIRGNLLLIPLGDSYLYVEPVFLQAEEGGLPELKRVIVAIGDQIAMQETLAASLSAIFAELPSVPAPAPPAPAPTAPDSPSVPQTPSGDVNTLVSQAQAHYDQAQAYLQAGDWTGYGSELEALKAVLDELGRLTGK